MNDISKINIGGGEYSLKDNFIRKHCIRTDLPDTPLQIDGTDPIIFNCAELWKNYITWNPLRFIYEYESGKHSDIFTFNISNLKNIGDLDVNFHSYTGDTTFTSNGCRDLEPEGL